MAHNDYVMGSGNVLCKGSGLRVFMEVPLTKTDSNGLKVVKYFTYDIGNLQQIIAETNRAARWTHAVGRKNPVAVTQALRNTYGTIVFSQIDNGFLRALTKDVRKYNTQTKMFAQVNLNGWGFEEYTILEEDQRLLSGPTENLVTELYEDEIIDLTDLPPVNIVVYGTADDIDDSIGRYEKGKIYMFRCNLVTFLSETFGVSAGTPMHDVATKVQILGSIEPWREVENQKLNEQ